MSATLLCVSCDDREGAASAGRTEHDAAPPRPTAVLDALPAAPAPAPEVEEALALILEGRAGAARERLLDRLERFPRDGDALFFLGLSYHREKRYAQARPHFEAAVALGPRFSRFHSAWHFLGWARFYLGELDEARAAFQAHLDAQPAAAASRAALGRIDMEKGDPEAAVRHLRLAIALERDGRAREGELARHHLRLADALLALGDDAAAAAELERSLALRPQQHSAHYKLYLLHTRGGETTRAAHALAGYRKYAPLAPGTDAE